MEVSAHFDISVVLVFKYCKAPKQFPFTKPTILTDESEFPVGTSLKYECFLGYFENMFSITCLENLVSSSAKIFRDMSNPFLGANLCISKNL